MALMPWNEELELGIAKLDEQHRWLANGINALHEELSRPDPDRGTLGEILETLVDYMMNHFIVEDEILARHGQPRTETHLAEHNGFIGQIIALLDQFQNQGAELGHEATSLLKDWLTHHILVLDKYYVPFLKVRSEH